MASAAGAANSARVEVVRTDLGERLTTDIDSAEASRGQAGLDSAIAELQWVAGDLESLARHFAVAG